MRGIIKCKVLFVLCLIAHSLVARHNNIKTVLSGDRSKNEQLCENNTSSTDLGIENVSIAHKTYFIKRLQQGEHLKIAALGTSLTGGTWRWFDVMKEWLDEEYPGQIIYLNEGIGASASSYPPGKSGLDKVRVVTESSPDVVFIEFAVNDAYKPYDISVDESRINLESMIATLQNANPEVEIVLQTMNLVIDMPELNMEEATKRSDLPKYLNMYRKVAKEKQLLLIDHYPNWKNYYKTKGRNEYIKIVTDGIHPNLEGYRMIVLPELKKKLLFNNKTK